jgi:hypothetical protein
MDSDQTGNSPGPSEIELVYNEPLTAFGEWTSLEAKRDDVLTNGTAKAKRLYEVVGPDNWEPFLKTKRIKRHGKAKGLF